MLDFLKRLFPPAEKPKNPLLGMEPGCVRYEWLTLRLPTGWRFTQADGPHCEASGPGGCSVNIFFARIGGQGIGGESYAAKAAEFEQNRKALLEMASRQFLQVEAAAVKTLPTGVLWMEATDSAGKADHLRIVVINPKPRNSELLPAFLTVDCTLPAGSATSPFGAERLEALRAALRGAEWN